MIYNMKKTNGFTMIEALLVTAVFAIVLTMAFPNFIQFFEMQKEQSEELQIAEIRKAMDAYLRSNKEFPDMATWVDDLSMFADINRDQIEFDVWGFRRDYRVVTETVTFRDADVDVDYAIVYGYGADNCLGVDSTCDPATDLLAVGVLGDQSDYEDFEVQPGDYLLKMSSYQYMMEGYKETLHRMTKISEALVDYSQSMLNEDILSGVANVENYIYYPPSNISADSMNNYASSVKSDVNTISGSSNYRINVSNNDAARRDSMETLMRILGLPDEYCCSDIMVGDDNEPFPFYYYSNPRPRLGASTCGTRPVGTTPRKLAPRVIATEPTAGTCG